MIKKLLIFLLAISMMLALDACDKKDDDSKERDQADTAISEDKKDDKTETKEEEPTVPLEDLFDWENVDGGIKITKYKGSDVHVVVPDIIENKKVVSIGNTFDGNVVMESIVLPKYATKVDLTDCDSLKRVEWNVTDIDFGSYYKAFPESLEELYLPSATKFKFGIIENRGENLRVLEIPACTGAPIKNSGTLESVTISKDVRYAFYHLGELCGITEIEGEAVGLYEMTNETQWVELTDAEREDIFAQLFGENCVVNLV